MSNSNETALSRMGCFDGVPLPPEQEHEVVWAMTKIDTRGGHYLVDKSPVSMLKEELTKYFLVEPILVIIPAHVGIDWGRQEGVDEDLSGDSMNVVSRSIGTIVNRRARAARTSALSSQRIYVNVYH